MAANRDNGFTLIEVLVAVTLLALLAVMLAPAIRSVTQADQRLRSQIGAGEGHLRLETLLRDALANLQPQSEGGSDGGLAGTGGEVQLWVRYPETGELGQLVITLEADSAVATMIAADSLGGRPEVSRITGLGAGARFYYYGETETRDALAWHTEWPYNHLPRLVVLDLERVDGEVRRLEIEVPARAGFDCTFDSGLGVCLGGSD